MSGKVRGAFVAGGACRRGSRARVKVREGSQGGAGCGGEEEDFVGHEEVHAVDGDKFFVESIGGAVGSGAAAGDAGDDVAGLREAW